MREFEEIYDVSIFVLTDDNEMVSGDEADHVDNARFVMLTNDLLNPDYDDDNSIVFSVRWRDYVDGRHLPDNIRMQRSREKKDIVDYCPYYIGQMWQVESKWRLRWYDKEPIGEAGHSINGYMNQCRIMRYMIPLLQDYRHSRKEKFEVRDMDEYLPAIMAAYNAVEEFQGNHLHGYLPAITQIEIMSVNVNDLNGVIYEGIEGCANFPTTIKYTDNDAIDLWLWSSTDCDGVSVHTFESGITGTNDKTDYFHYTLPLYRLV